MQRLLLSLFFFVLTPLFTQIIELPHFDMIASFITPNTVLVLDIDDTLMVPVQMLGNDEWFQARVHHHSLQGASYQSALEKSLAEWEGIRQITEMRLVEPDIDRYVQSLQKLECLVMGMTTQGLALATRTALQLKSLNIDLSQHTPSSQDYYFPNQGHGVLYRKGILFTSGTPKGQALFQFFKFCNYEPTRIVFVNDKASHLQDVEVEAQNHGIEYIGLRYGYSDKYKKEFDLNIADFQFKNSSFAHILSDQEALALVP